MISDEDLWEINRIGQLRAPAEACGLLLPTPDGYTDEGRPRRVVEMPNRSKTPHNTYMFTTDDVKISLERWLKLTDPELHNDVIVWHTHPGGNIGPSAEDMRQKQTSLTYVVVALTPNGPVPAMF